MDAHVPAGKTPVFNLLGHEIFVRNQMFLAVPRDDRNRPDTDLVDPSEAAADCDHIARLDRAVHQQDQSRDQIAEGLLKAKRSEEHTSELQSLMRISYAVFCLKKKKKSNTI